MLRYDHSDRRPPNYLARKEQWRLLRLLLAMGLVIFLMDQVRRPHAARVLSVFFGVDREVNDGQVPRQLPLSPAHRQDDFADLPGVTQVDPQETLGESLSQGLSDGPGVDGLEVVKDNGPFRSREMPAWYRLLGSLHRADEKRLWASSVGEVTAVQLKEQPGAYRGRLVTIRGIARQAIELDPFESTPAATDLLGLYWFSEFNFPSMAIRGAMHEWFLSGYRRVVVQQFGTSFPIIAFSLSAPDAFPTGDSLDEPISLTGYFFKNWLYPAGEQLGVAPVVLTKRIRWLPPAPPLTTDRSAGDRVEVVLALAISALMSAIVVCWLVHRSRQPVGAVPRPSSPAATPDFSLLKGSGAGEEKAYHHQP